MPPLPNDFETAWEIIKSNARRWREKGRVIPSLHNRRGSGNTIDSVDDIYAEPFIEAMLAGDWGALDPWSCFLHESSLSSSSIPRLRDTPVLVVYGSEDTLVVPEFQQEDFALLCEQGWSLEQIECAQAPHAEGTLWSLPAQLDWLRARLDGVPQDPSTVCVWNEPVCCPATPAEQACGE